MAHGGKGVTSGAHRDELAEETPARRRYADLIVRDAVRFHCGDARIRLDRSASCCILSTSSRSRHRCCRSSSWCLGAAVCRALHRTRHQPAWSAGWKRAFEPHRLFRNEGANSTPRLTPTTRDGAAGGYAVPAVTRELCGSTTAGLSEWAQIRMFDAVSKALGELAESFRGASRAHRCR